MNDKELLKKISLLIVFSLILLLSVSAVAQDQAEGLSIHGDLEGQTILFTEETVPINAGTVFAPKVDGVVTHIKVYTAKEEHGQYIAQIWDADLGTILLDQEWTIEAGIEGWQYCELDEPLELEALQNYMVCVMNNAESMYFARIEAYFQDSEDVNSMFITESDSGKFTVLDFVLPNQTFNNRTYLRDIVFIPGETKKAPKQDIDLSEIDTVYISDLKWGESYSNTGLVIKDGASQAEDLVIKDSTYEKGFAMYASAKEGDSFVEIDIEGLGLKTFAAYVGIGKLLFDKSVEDGSVEFIVSADGEELGRTELIKFGDDPYLFIADISGAKILRLSVGPGADGNKGDLAAWANACVSKLNASEGEKIFDSVKTVEKKTDEPTNEDKVDTTPKADEKDETKKSDIKIILIIVAALIAFAAICIVAIIVIKKRK